LDSPDILVRARGQAESESSEGQEESFHISLSRAAAEPVALYLKPSW
jgi:hypothetical protein